MVKNDFLHTEQGSKIESFFSIKLTKFNPDFSVVGIFLQERVKFFNVFVNSSLFLFINKIYTFDAVRILFLDSRSLRSSLIIFSRSYLCPLFTENETNAESF